MSDEQWRPIPGFENIYEASSLGRIRSIDRIRIDRNGRPIQLRGRIKEPRLNEKGYLRISLTNGGGRQRDFFVQRLVLAAFSGGNRPDMHARHLDGNQLNNCIVNLEWGTPVENSEDKFRHGTQPLGEECHTAKLTVADVLRIMKREKSAKAFAKEYGVSPGAIKHIWAGRNWVHITARGAV